jgi:bifunctional DNA-binding transcriptional regulator/antitoxin component of YhaV-PrlF toxin-antitoxin module
MEIINTSASPIEIRKNVKLGEGEPLEHMTREEVGKNQQILIGCMMYHVKRDDK